VTEPLAMPPGDGRSVWIVEDEPAAAALAAELCRSCGGDPTVFRAPLPFLAALRGTVTPSAVVLDWRLEHELSAALFLATRHRHPRLPVIYWTGSAVGSLPEMIRSDAHTTIVDKAAGSSAFEEAIGWALEADGIHDAVRDGARRASPSADGTDRRVR
jgi:DNA-binding NtrC family response regulator